MTHAHTRAATRSSVMPTDTSASGLLLLGFALAEASAFTAAYPSERAGQQDDGYATLRESRRSRMTDNADTPWLLPVLLHW
jgi:hypothetical protein